MNEFKRKYQINSIIPRSFRHRQFIRISIYNVFVNGTYLILILAMGCCPRRTCECPSGLLVRPRLSFIPRKVASLKNCRVFHYLISKVVPWTVASYRYIFVESWIPLYSFFSFLAQRFLGSACCLVLIVSGCTGFG